MTRLSLGENMGFLRHLREHDHQRQSQHSIVALTKAMILLFQYIFYDIAGTDSLEFLPN